LNAFSGTFMNKDKTKKLRSLLAYYSSESTMATEFRRIFANIRVHNSGKEVKTLLITSSTLGEGKSTIASLLAVTVAQRYNRKVLLLDADLRRATIHHHFCLNRTQGLTELLEGESQLRDIIKASDLENLKIITAGRHTDKPAELLDEPRFKQLIDELRFYHDLLIIDSAPVVPVSDAIILGQQADGVVLVVKAGKTQREVVKRACELLQGSNFRVIGVIMNNMKEMLPYYYNYKYYGYENDSPDKKQKQ